MSEEIKSKEIKHEEIKQEELKSEKMTLRGFGWDHRTQSVSEHCSSLPYEQPYSNMGPNKEHNGMPISAEAAYNAIQRFYQDVIHPGSGPAPFKDIAYVEFSKASLFRIISQETCDFVRFYFAIPDKKLHNASLVLEGMTKDKRPVKYGIMVDILRAQEGSGPAVDATQAPQYEEKGNGGGGKGNIQSMREQIAIHQNKHGVTEAFSDFVTKTMYP